MENKYTQEEITHNIHILPSRFPKGIHLLDYHITSDEEIKEGDWFIDDKYKQPMKYFGEGSLLKSSKKIILTTDQDLIKDGVQPIGEEFFEWFVKNQSCEFVEVKLEAMFKGYMTFPESINEPPFHGNLKYKIIIPKEEPKQLTDLEVAQKLEEIEREEAIEEAAIDSKKRYINETAKTISYREFIEGAKWQAKRSYSEEDMREAFIAGGNSQIEEDDAYGSAYFKYMEKWFEQFKKN
jgi:hypothetical protein